MRPSLRSAPWQWRVSHNLLGGAETDFALVTPPAGQRVFVHKIILTKAVGDVTATLEFGTTRILDVTIADALGTAELDMPFEAPVGGLVDEPLLITTSGVLTVQAYYSLSDAP